jgi:hypothetical protein
MATQRVMWRHDCPMPDYCGYERGGVVWIPKDALTEAFSLSPYEVAQGLGLTADDAPDPSRPHVMVAWDCRPGALQVHYWDELEVVAGARLGQP